ncbi:MAG TPA: hypothetical protein VF629_24565 [Hymenobacter sp.]|jgi:hypothetical protein|uniref:hypothetical protein n=1 Tax=Hymenobacter sp. TaxID=1898978 RepID=UPI002ED96562
MNCFAGFVLPIAWVKLYEDDNSNGVYHPDGTARFTVTLDKNELAGPADSYNLASTSARGAGGLSDALTVRDGAALGFNTGAERGYGGSGQYAPAGSSFAAELCGQMRLLVAQEGRVELGNAQGHTAAVALADGGLLEAQNGGLLRVSAGSVLTVRRGATLVVRNGGSLLVDGQVRVESGAFLCVETGANLVFSAGAELFVDPAATLGTNPVLGLPASTGCSGQLAVCGQLTGGHAGVTNSSGRNEALQFDGDDVVSIPNTNSYVNELSQQFAVEAYLRADDLSAPGSQTLFSSRKFSSSGTSGTSGILFPSTMASCCCSSTGATTTRPPTKCPTTTAATMWP